MKAIKFGEVRKSFVDLANIPARDLLPLIPSNAVLGEGSKVINKQLGKIPGRFKGGKWYGLTGGWAAFGMTPQDQENSAHWPTETVGLRAADWPGVDADVETPQARELVEKIILDTLGAAPVRGRGNSPRALFVYRRGDDMPIRKIRLEFAEIEGGEVQAVEVLGHGQHYVINGMHNSGVAYEWRDGKDLRQRGADTLTPVTAGQLAECMTQIENAIRAKGWIVIKTHKPKYGMGVNGRAALSVNNLDPIVEEPGLARELALAALNSLENNYEQFPTREDFLSLASSFKHVLGREADAAFPDFLMWAVRNADDGFAYGPEDVKAIWDSLTTVRVSPDHLFNLARKRGFRGDAKLDFAGMEIDLEDASPVVNGQVDAAVLEREKYASVEAQLLYIEPSMTWVVRGRGTELSHAAFNSSELGTLIAEAGTSGKNSASNQLINRGNVKKIDGITYLAGKPEVVSWENEGHKGLYYNRWHPAPQALLSGDIELWLKHAENLFPRKEEREHLFDYLAFLVQRRGEKVRYAPIIIGGQGTGKDLFLKPLVQYFAHNCAEVQPEQLQAKFNSFVERELIIVQEMVRHDKKEAYDNIKVMIAGSGKDTLTVERKFKNPYTVPNNVNMVFLTNHLDSVNLEDDDRRFFVLQSDMERRDEAYYTKLAKEFYEDQSGWRKVIYWLMQRDISEFNKDGTPPDTVGKQEMKSAQKPPYQITIQKELDGGYHKDRTVMTDEELFDTVTKDFNYPMDPSSRRFVTSTGKIKDALRRAGWKQQRAQVRVNKRATRLWVRNADMVELEPTTLRAVMEAEIKNQNKFA